MPAIFNTEIILPTSYILCGLLSESVKGAVLSTIWAYSVWWVQFFIQIFLCVTALKSCRTFSCTFVAKNFVVFFLLSFSLYPTCGAGTYLNVNLFLNLILSSLAHTVVQIFQTAAWMNQRFQPQAKHCALHFSFISIVSH